MPSLKEKTITGVFWSFLQKAGAQGIQFIITIVLARLLAPEDFGLIGMLAVFIAISQSIVEGGFNKALIQKKDADEEDFSTVFFINLSVSFLIYWILYFTAPYIATFFNQPKLTLLTRVLSILFILNAFGYVQETKLIKDINFKRLMVIHLPSTILSGIVAIIFAYKGFGVWSIVAQRLSMRSAFVLQMWLYSNWKPIWIFNKQKAKELFTFGGNLMAVSIIQTIYLNAYKVVIGKFYPVKSLGYYETANSIASAPISTISSVMSSVTFPVFSSIQNDNLRLKLGYKKTIQQVLFIIAPLIIISAVLAEPIFRFVLTEKWLPAVPYFQILCVGFVFRPLNEYNIQILNVKGHSGLFLKIDILKKVLETIGIAVSLIFFNIWFLIWFQSLFTLIKYIINSFFSGKFINYSIFNQLKDISGILIISISIATVIYFLNVYTRNFIPDWLTIVSGFSLGGALYLYSGHLFRLEAYRDFIDIAKPITRKIINKTK